MFQVGDLVEWSLPLVEDRRRPIGIITELVNDSPPGREPGFMVEWFDCPTTTATSYEFAYCLRLISEASEREQ